MNRAQILAAVDVERERQRVKWSRQHEWGYGDCSCRLGFMFIGAKVATTEIQFSNLIKGAVLAEEAGEVVKAALDVDEIEFRAEVIQTLAVAWAILEGISE